MALLQSIISGDLVLAFCLGVFLLAGIPVLATLVMKVYWNIAGKKENSKTAKEDDRNIIPFISIIIFSATALLLLVYLLITLFDNSSPPYGS